MLIRTLILLSAFVLTFSLTNAEETLDEVIEKYKEASKTDEILAKKAMHAKLKMQMMAPQEMTIDMEFWHKKDDQYRVEQVTPMGAVTMVIKGDKAWAKTPMGTQEIPMDETQNAKLTSDIVTGPFSEEIDPEKTMVTLEGKVEEGDKNLIKIKLIDLEEGRVSYVYLDAITYLMDKYEVTDGNDITVMQVTERKKADGIILPKTIEITHKGELVQKMIFEEFEFKDDISDSYFMKP